MRIVRGALWRACRQERRMVVSAIRIGGGNFRLLPQRKTRNPDIRLTLKERTR
jgi:hypothetical protein